MAKKLTKEKLKENVDKKISESEYTELVSIIYNDKDLCNSIIVLKCTKHDELYKLSYSRYVHDHRVKNHCDSCKKEAVREAGKALWANEEEEIKKLKEYIKKSNSLGTDIEFAGIVDEWKGYVNTKILIKCNKHNITTETTIDNVMKRGDTWNCKECKKEKLASRSEYTPKEAREVLEIKFPNSNLNFSKVEKTYKGCNSEVTITCPKHGDFTRVFSNISNSYNPMCPDCMSEYISSINSYTFEQAVARIENTIIKKNTTYGSSLEFVGFVDNKWIGRNTKLILKCTKHNNTWTSTNYHDFCSTDVIGCLDCSMPGYSSKKEYYCITEILKYFSWDYIDTQHKIYLDEETKRLINHNEFIKADIYIKSLNAIIEYNGGQHYESTWLFHKGDNQKFIDQVNRDIYLRKYCKENNIKLLVIPYVDDKRIPEIIEKFIKEGIDTATKLEPHLLPAIVEDNCRSLVRYG